MGHIYIITCLVNNKVYIGQTTETIVKRFNRHIYDAKKYASMQPNISNNKKRFCTKLVRAMSKYGIDKFYISQLEEVQKENLNEREKYYILLYNSTKEGYNLSSGGDRPTHSEVSRKKISESVRNRAKNNIDSFRKHSELHGLPPKCIYVVIKGSEAVAINKHEKCRWKSFTARKYGTLENAKIELLKYLRLIENQ